MAVETTQSIIQYQGNGSVEVGYPFPYLFFADEQIKVVITAPDGVDTRLTLGEDYTVSGAGNEAGGEVFTLTEWSEHYRLTIFREVEPLQLFVYKNLSKFPAQSHESALDYLTFCIQQLYRQMERTLRVSETSPNFIDLDDRAGKVLMFDEWGNVSLKTPEELVGSFIGNIATKAELAIAIEDVLRRTAAGRSYVNLLLAGALYEDLESGYFAADFDTELLGVFLSVQTPGKQVTIEFLDGDDTTLAMVVLPENERHKSVWFENPVWIYDETTIRAKCVAADGTAVDNPQFLNVVLILQKPAPNEEEVGEPEEPPPPPPSNWQAGMLSETASSTVPSGWLECNGQAVSRADYADLFTAIGTTWGHGDGSTTFNVPNLSRRVTVGRGGVLSPELGNQIGNLGGAENIVLTVPQLPSHTHQQGQFVLTDYQGGGYGLASGGLWSGPPRIHSRKIPSVATGGNEPHSNIQPSAVVMKIIKT